MATIACEHCGGSTIYLGANLTGHECGWCDGKGVVTEEDDDDSCDCGYCDNDDGPDYEADNEEDEG